MRAYVQYVQTSTDGRGGGGGEVDVIFNAEGKESHGSGRCWSERYVCLLRWLVPSRTELSYMSAIFTYGLQSVLF